MEGHNKGLIILYKIEKKNIQVHDIYIIAP